MGAIYWVGQDGNIWLKSGVGATAQNVGRALNVGDEGFDSTTMSGIATQLKQDPNAPSTTTNVTAPTSPNGGSTTPRVDKSNDIGIQNAGLASLDGQEASGISAIDQALGTLKGQYGTETAANEGSYTTNSDSNMGNKQKNTQTALVNAAQGRQGLFGSLASIGALNGDGISLANRAVQKGANDDLSGAADNFSTNQLALDSAIGGYRRENERRNDNADTAATNAKTNLKNETAKTRMSHYTNLANDYSAMGDEGTARDYTGRASAMYPTISATNLPDSNIGYSGAAYTAPSLASYMAGADSTAVNTTPAVGGQMPGLVASPTKKKQQTVTV